MNPFGRSLPAGSIAAVSPLLLHHDPRWFPAPETFDPGRWIDPQRQAAPRYTYLPFGTGPRVQYRVTLRPAAGLPAVLHAGAGSPADRVP